MLARVLDAAHHMPSAGFMQPWNFIVIAALRTRAQVLRLYQRERVVAAQFFDETCRSQYLSKVQIVQRGRELGVPIDETWSCYMGDETPCGMCDSCRLREEALAAAGG
jgi:7-cyano-7-deazaguanine synthase in queuosine biosynthesis